MKKTRQSKLISGLVTATIAGGALTLSWTSGQELPSYQDLQAAQSLRAEYIQRQGGSVDFTDINSSQELFDKLDSRMANESTGTTTVKDFVCTDSCKFKKIKHDESTYKDRLKDLLNKVNPDYDKE